MFKTLLYILIIFCCRIVSFAQLSGSIYNVDSLPGVLDKKLPIIDMGLCFYENDSLSTTFTLVNSCRQMLMIDNKTSNIALNFLDYPNYPYHNWFFSSEPTPIFINPYSQSKIQVLYKPGKLLQGPTYSEGKKIVYLQMGLFDADSAYPTINAFATQRKFVLIARKTTKYLDSYEHFLDFDTIYKRNYTDSSKKDWKVKNVGEASFSIDSSRFKPYFTNSGFSIWTPNDSMIYPFSVSPKEILNWSISFKPKRIGYDSASYSLFYNQTPDTVKEINTTMRAVGGVQDITVDSVSDYDTNISTIIESSASDTFSRYLLDMGDFPVGMDKEMNVYIRNNGNIPIGILDQLLINQINDDTVSGSYIVTKLQKNRDYLFPTLNDSFKVHIKAIKRGESILRYAIYTDITSRKIYGVPNYAKRLIIYIRLRGIEPEIKFSPDSIDFGTIHFSSDCPVEKSMTLKVTNIGNIKLTNYKILFNSVNSLFTFSPNYLELEPEESATISVSLIPQIYSPLENIEIAKFITNCFPPADTSRLKIRVFELPKIQNRLELSDRTIKPGTPFILPIIDSSSIVGLASAFKDTLDIIDPSSVVFDGFIYNNTASEGANIEINQIKNKLAININHDNFNHFISRDTLILLKFKTYLGEFIESDIKFTKPKFSDKSCENIFNLEDRTKDAKITFDSICGLKSKLKPINNKYFSLNIYTENSEIVDLNFETSEKSNIEIKIYDTYGNISKQFSPQVYEKGLNSLSFGKEDLASGTYICELQTTGQIFTRRFFIIK